MEKARIKETQSAEGLLTGAMDYCLDSFQRNILFMDIMRKRGNVYLEFIEKGQPPVLTFEYDIIMDGRSMENPVNHDLAYIRPEKGELQSNERPIIVIDPRAGHGPGIGGSKQDSEIGMALKAGHPVYFILFYPDPAPGQTYAHVKDAQVEFIKEVQRRHPESDEPAVIGNCQAGWAVALLGAERPDITGPLVLNGSPLSYWAGVEGQNMMRYRGGLLGGIWLTSFLCDLGNGKFDGANLVMNFEDLNPANTLWSKQYNLWAKVDTEEERYLNFEKWWNSYFMMTSDEIHFILKNLFVGNLLETGQVELDKGRKIDLKNLEDPVLIFASSGDNITPPQQALNWVVKVYDSVDDIINHDQVIVYRVHENVGHLGIFVSAKVAKKEHKEFVEDIDSLEFLPPGLYEMIIEENPGNTLVTDYKVTYKERTFQDIIKMDDGFEDEENFKTAAALSDYNLNMYDTFLSPWVRMWSNEQTAKVLKESHPLRFSRAVFSDLNPFMGGWKFMAEAVKEERKEVSSDNFFKEAEGAVSKSVEATLDCYRDCRDLAGEFMFNAVYGNSFMKTLFPDPPKIPVVRPEPSPTDFDPKKEMEKGGFSEGVVRILVAIVGIDKDYERREMDLSERITGGHPALKKITRDEYIDLVKKQSRIIKADFDRAINALPKLLPPSEDVSAFMKLLKDEVENEYDPKGPEAELFERIKGLVPLESVSPVEPE